MRVLGLDPGSRRTGYGVVERRGNQLACLGQGCIRTKADASLAQRLAVIASATEELLATWTPDSVVVEEAFHHEHARSSLVLGHVRGALLVVVARSGVHLAEYSPRSIKLGVTGSGASTKEQVASMVTRLLALKEVPGSDAADALAGAICHLHRRSAASPVTRSGARRTWADLLVSRGSR